MAKKAINTDVNAKGKFDKENVGENKTTDEVEETEERWDNIQGVKDEIRRPIY